MKSCPECDTIFGEAHSNAQYKCPNCGYKPLMKRTSATADRLHHEKLYGVKPTQYKKEE